MSLVSTMEVTTPVFGSEMDIARLYQARLRGQLLYVGEASRWFWYDGRRWQRDELGKAQEAAKQVVLEYEYHLRNEQKSLGKVGMSKKTVLGVLGLAQSDPDLAATIAQFDKEMHLLNTPGGVVDLRTGETRPHCATDYMTMITSVAPNGDCPTFKKFLNEAAGGNDDLVSWLQRFFGYCLTGSVHEEIFAFLHGGGGNGKGTLVLTIAGCMGDYAASAPPSFLIEKFHDEHLTELAGLKGKRVAFCQEVPKQKHWDETKLKMLTGNEGNIRARFMRGDMFEYEPQFKLVVTGNYRPHFHTVDPAIERRLRLVPFDHTPKEMDHNLKDKLREEWPGILAWMIEGCVCAHKSGGVGMVEAVKVATAEYLTEEDSVREFIEKLVVSEAGARLYSADAYEGYKTWCAGRRSPEERRNFVAKMQSRYPNTDTGSGNKLYFKDVKLRAAGGWVAS